MIITDFDEDKDGSSDSSDMEEYGWGDSDDEERRPKVKAKPRPTKPTSLQKPPPNVKDYMDIMDRELASTNVGKSFEKNSKPQQSKVRLSFYLTAGISQRIFLTLDQDLPISVLINQFT